MQGYRYVPDIGLTLIKVHLFERATNHQGHFEFI